MRRAAAARRTTRGLAVPERRPILHALVEKGLLPIEPLSAARSVELVKWRLPGASVLWGRLTRSANVPSAEADDLFFGINVAGAGLARQRGREATVEPGDAVVQRLAEGPFSVLRPPRAT